MDIKKKRNLQLLKSMKRIVVLNKDKDIYRKRTIKVKELVSKVLTKLNSRGQLIWNALVNFRKHNEKGHKGEKELIIIQINRGSSILNDKKEAETYRSS